MTTHTTHEAHGRAPVDTSAKPDVLRRLAYIDGHLQGVKRMIEDDKYCVDVLKQTYAVRRAIEKLEARILESHLQGCVVAGIKEGREDAVIGELLELYEQAGR
jgi:DNA-binding FrmR family transcriptional regulator